MNVKGLKPIALSVALSMGLALTGCGSSGGSTSTDVSKIEGSVEASVLEGVKVCIKDTNVCTTTNSSGNFELDGSYPATLTLSVGKSKLGEVNVNANTTITPAVLADGNVTLAGYIGSLLHKAGGCSVTSSYCNLSKVDSIDINANGNDLVQKVKNAVKDSGLTAQVNGSEVNVTSSDIDAYVTSNPVVSGKGDITYQGVMTLGDYAEFTFDLNKDAVNFQIKGDVLGKVDSTSEIYNMYKNMLFVNKDGSNFYYLTAGVMFSTIMQNGLPYTVIGIPKNYLALSVSDVEDKRFNILLRNAKIGNYDVTSIASLYLSDNHTFSFVTKDLYGNVIKENGTWSFSNSKVYLKDSDGNDFMILAVKKGEHQNIVVADFTNGGFGLGIESVPMSGEDMTRYSYVKFTKGIAKDTDEVCLGRVAVSKVDTKEIKVNETDLKCFAVHVNTNVNAVFFEEILPHKPISYTATIDPSVNIDGDNIELNSVAVSIGTVNSVSIIDGDNGLFAQLGTRDGKEVAILGSNKLLH